MDDDQWQGRGYDEDGSFRVQEGALPVLEFVDAVSDLRGRPEIQSTMMFQQLQHVHKGQVFMWVF